MFVSDDNRNSQRHDAKNCIKNTRTFLAISRNAPPTKLRNASIGKCVFVLGMRFVEIHSISQHFHKVSAKMNAISSQFFHHFNPLPTKGRWLYLTFRHRASCLLGQAFRYSPENAFYIFNQQIYFII